MWLQAHAFDIVSPQNPQPHAKTCEDGEEYFWWDQSWRKAGSFFVERLYKWYMEVLGFSAKNGKHSEYVSKF